MCIDGTHTYWVQFRQEAINLSMCLWIVGYWSRAWSLHVFLVFLWREPTKTQRKHANATQIEPFLGTIMYSIHVKMYPLSLIVRNKSEKKLPCVLRTLSP